MNEQLDGAATQLANCRETMQKDGVRHAKALLALEADEAAIVKLRTTLEAVEWVGAHLYCPWCLNKEEDGHKPDCARQAALNPREGEE